MTKRIISSNYNFTITKKVGLQLVRIFRLKMIRFESACARKGPFAYVSRSQSKDEELL